MTAADVIGSRGCPTHFARNALGRVPKAQQTMATAAPCNGFLNEAAAHRLGGGLGRLTAPLLQVG
jgi:hypothetical protein